MDLSPSRQPPAALARSNLTACVRCRQKKRRCDQKMPACSLCQAAGVECVSYDAVAKREIPRSYVLSLEERVAYLEITMKSRGIPYDDLEVPETSPSMHSANTAAQMPGPSSPAPETSSEATNIASIEAAKATYERVMGLAQRSPAEDLAFSKILLEDVIKSQNQPQLVCEPNLDQFPARKRLPPAMMSDLMASQITLPIIEVAKHLVDAYFQFANAGMPLLHEPTFRHKLQLLYQMPPQIDFATTHTDQTSRIAVFYTFEVFAIAIVIMQKRDPSSVPTSLADRYHGIAVRALGETGLPGGVEGVQALLLSAQFSYHHPTTWDVWKTVGAAMRLAIGLGLHRDPQPIALPDTLALDTMRRVFWTAYSMDRSISIALAMPLGIPDGAITAKFPSLVDDEFITSTGVAVPEDQHDWTKQLSHHLFRYRQLQSEMQTTLYENRLPEGTLSAEEWQEDMHGRIRAWFEDCPRSSSFTDSERIDLENFELSHQRALLYLYSPSPKIPAPSDSVLVTVAGTATKIIKLYRRFFREYRLTIYWQAIENLASAGTVLLFSYVNSATVRQQFTFQILESLMHTCSSVLWGMVEHFPAFKGKRDAFDVLVSETMANITTTVPGFSGSEQAYNHNDPASDGRTGQWLVDAETSPSFESQHPLQTSVNVLDMELTDQDVLQNTANLFSSAWM